MAAEDTPETRPSVDDLGFDHPEPDEYADLATDLRSTLDGDVRFDEYAQILYATDGSIYQARPAGVCVPTDTADVQAAIEIASQHDVPVLPRGCGSSLAGQAVGPGCVVLDLSKHMDGIIDIDPDERIATVQPGVVQDHLDAELASYGLKFAPDPASSARATVGGGIGNNSTGAHSVRYGITDAYTEELEVVLADGSRIHTRPVVIDSPEWNDIVAQDDIEARIYETVRALIDEHEDEIEARYPTLKRAVSGYNLHKVSYEDEQGNDVINLSKLFVGAEGTLGVVTEATVSLVTVPERTAVVLYCFDDLLDAMRAVPEALDYDASAVELMDDEVFRLANQSSEYAQYAEPIPDGTAAALMLEFDSEVVDDFQSAVGRTNTAFLQDGAAYDAIEAYTDADQADLWKLRKAAIPLLMSLQGDPKPYPFIEDASVPPAELADYVQKFEDVLEDHDTSAAYFAHAGSGTLHIRPILNIKSEDGVEAMHSIADDVTDLVLEHHGAFSGEHGDGMARTEFNPKMYGPDLWRAFKELKTVFDPDWLLHPGNVVYRDDGDEIGPDSDRGVGADMREHLRYGPAYKSLELQTTLDFDDEGGFSHLVELCNGCGTCRQTEGDVMCPTYRASEEELQSTRGRANMLRAAISGELEEDTLYSERFQREVLDLCVGCKGCASDCPTGVDLAKLKAEVKHQYHTEKDASIRSRLFANIDRFAALGSTLAPIANRATGLPGARWLLERTVGIASDRELPEFTSRTLEDWFEDRGGSTVPAASTDHKVVLFPDTYTNYSTPDIGKAAVRVLEAADVHVEIPSGLVASGRAAYSMGFLDLARERAARNARALRPLLDDGYHLVTAEPSDAVVFQDEYRDLHPEDPAVAALAENAYGFCEYLDIFEIDREIQWTTPEQDASLTYHGHCNQKAMNTDHHAVAVLRRAGYTVDPLDSSCCGMAGSFGYEAEHYDLSRAIGRILEDQVSASAGDTVVAPGTSCRTQLAGRTGTGTAGTGTAGTGTPTTSGSGTNHPSTSRQNADRPTHPIEKLEDALPAR